ncbi:MAG: LPS assembly protein LptD [Acetobacteraceae bacterium]|jgi:LPS-assembly protein
MAPVGMVAIRRFRLVVLLAMLLASMLSGAAQAQLSEIANLGSHQPASRNQPVTFTADTVEYDRENSLVIAQGHVEAWQDDHVLRADRVTFDRNSGVSAAKGNVVLLEPDGQVLFADYAELTQDMKSGVLRDMRAILAENARMAANGARRTEGEINEMSKVVYSTCNLCAKDPTRPPLWQIRALSAVQDLEHKKIEFQDAVMEMYGVPVGYMPYFWTVDPSVKRASGLLIPSMGVSSHIGAFFAQPYYWVIDDQSDATFTPMITTEAGPQLSAEYRRRFNNGSFVVDGSLGYLDNSVQGTIYTKGQFNLDDTWRWGFNIARASSPDYVRDFHIGAGDLGSEPTLLTSQIYAEGFGQGSYSRFDVRFYQTLNEVVVSSELPLVLPRYQYSYFGQPDSWGGRFSLDAGAFNVVRSDGTNTRRANVTLNWSRPFVGALGDLWKVTLHTDAIAYDASAFNEQPNFGPMSQVNTARAQPQAALDFRWPFMRDSGAWGTQLIEPIAQIVVGPQVGNSQNTKYPNEDSLDLEFTDANLFGFNRYPGVDRLDGGVRANVALHGTWYLGGTTFDGLIGQSYRTTVDNQFSEASGLHDQVSDIVARASLAPTSWLNLTYRTRLDHKDLATRMADALATVGVPKFSVNAGYIYTIDNPYTEFDQPLPPPAGNAFYTPRNEVTVGASSNWGKYRLSAYARRDLQSSQMVAAGVDAVYEDECFILDFRFYRRYTSYNGDNGATTALFQLTFKTIGQFGFKAL